MLMQGLLFYRTGDENHLTRVSVAFEQFVSARPRRTSHMGRGSNKTGIFVSFQAVSDLEGTFMIEIANLA